jgi:hypothetical protein
MHTASLDLAFPGRVHHSTLREGAIAGLLGASGVALWLLIVDAANGQALFTPTTLGYGLFTLFGTTPSSTFTSVAFYTVFHYAAFVAVGVVLVGAIHQSRAHPSIFALMLILFMCFQLGFYGVVAIAAQSRLGELAWFQVGAANLVATIVMGLYLWRTHPLLGRVFGHGLVDDEPEEFDAPGGAATR